MQIIQKAADIAILNLEVSHLHISIKMRKSTKIVNHVQKEDSVPMDPSWNAEKVFSYFFFLFFENFLKKEMFLVAMIQDT